MEIELEMSLLFIYEISGLFVNTLTAVGKYSLHNREKLMQSIQIQLSKIQKLKKKIVYCLLHFWNLHYILNILKKNMTLIAYVFLKLQTARDVASYMPKKPSFRTPFDSQYAKGS